MEIKTSKTNNLKVNLILSTIILSKVQWAEEWGLGTQREIRETTDKKDVKSTDKLILVAQV